METTHANNRWVIIDTETDGFRKPIHVLELAGQLMEEWEPIGKPFRVLLNHDVWIHPKVTDIHGYSQDYLAQHGLNPREAHEAFRAYAGDLPIVAHNLRYDWDQCLLPEWNRLGIRPVGRRGFCSLELSRRLFPENEGHGLDLLKQCFGLTACVGHRALNDVQTVVELFQRIYCPRIEAAGVRTFQEIQKQFKGAGLATV